MRQIIAILVFIAVTAGAVVSGFASKSLIDQASASAQSAFDGTYTAVAVQQPEFFKLAIIAAVCLIASRLRWKSSDRS